MTILIVLVGVIIMAVLNVTHDDSAMFRIARRYGCVACQRQLVTMLIAYREEHGSLPMGPALFAEPWPVGREAVTAAARDRTLKCWEVLHAFDTGNIGAHLFRCPAGPSNPAWRWDMMPAANPGASTTVQPGYDHYALDWSVPPPGGANRIIMGDRHSAAHDGDVVVAFADGHTDVVSVNRNATPLPPQALVCHGSAIADGDAWLAPPPLSGGRAATPPDGIYDDHGDGPGALIFAGGSPLRCFLK